MPYAEWKARYQAEASDEQKQRFEATKDQHADTSAGN
jgi:hypothetical protein